MDLDNPLSRYTGSPRHQQMGPVSRCQYLLLAYQRRFRGLLSLPRAPLSRVQGHGGPRLIRPLRCASWRNSLILPHCQFLPTCSFHRWVPIRVWRHSGMTFFITGPQVPERIPPPCSPSIMLQRASNCRLPPSLGDSGCMRPSGSGCGGAPPPA